MRSVVGVLVLTAVLATAGCSADGEPPAESARQAVSDQAPLPSPEIAADPEPEPSTGSVSPATPAPAPPSPSSRTRTEEGEVPDVVGLGVERATATLRAAGADVRRLDVLGTACRPRDEVLAQRPAAGTRVAAAGRVEVHVNGGALGLCGLDAEPAGADLQRVAGAFVGFARGEQPGPPADTPIALLLGGRRVAMITGERQANRDAWARCPDGGYYAGRTCPISPVDTIAAHLGPLALTAQRPEHSCAHPTPVSPADVGASRAVTVTPDEDLDCTSFWAVELFVNDVGQVVAVNTVWAEP